MAGATKTKPALATGPEANPTTAGPGARNGSRRGAIEQALSQAGWDGSRVTRNYELTAAPARQGPGRGHHGAQHHVVAYVLQAVPGTPTAIVASVGANHNPETALRRAIRQGQRLDVPLVYVTNGKDIVEHSTRTNRHRAVAAFATPKRAWATYLKDRQLDRSQGDWLAQPFDPELFNGPDDQLRYYQIVAINRVMAAIAKDHARALLVMDPGAGRTTVALQVAAKARAARAAAGSLEPLRVLYLVDRAIAVASDLSDQFAPAFGPVDLSWPAGPANPVLFATARELASFDESPSRYPSSHFDLVVVDEARTSSFDRPGLGRLLQYFNRAFHLGMTCASRAEAAETYAYYGNPLYLYTAAQAKQDDFSQWPVLDQHSAKPNAPATIASTPRRRPLHPGGPGSFAAPAETYRPGPPPGPARAPAVPLSARHPSRV